MVDLFIYAYPAQMVTFQIVTPTGNIINNDNCAFEDTVRTASKYYQTEDVGATYVIGNTPFADKISDMITKAFSNRTVERIKND